MFCCLGECNSCFHYGLFDICESQVLRFDRWSTFAPQLVVHKGDFEFITISGSDMQIEFLFELCFSQLTGKSFVYQVCQMYVDVWACFIIDIIFLFDLL